VHAGSLEKVFHQLTEPLETAGDIDSDARHALVNELLQREKMHSTAMENGVAFPHLRSPENSPIAGPFALIGRCREGTEFGSPDGKATHLFFLIVTNSVVVHLRVLAQLTQEITGTGLPAKLLQVRSKDEAMAVFLS